MATTSKMELNFFEKLGDGFTRFTEGIVGFMTRLFGSSNERHIRGLGYLRSPRSHEHTVVPGSVLHQVNELEEKMLALSDDDFEKRAFERRLDVGVDLVGLDREEGLALLHRVAGFLVPGGNEAVDERIRELRELDVHEVCCPAV